MVDTKKVIGFYTDVFGTEMNEYEQVKNTLYGMKDAFLREIPTELTSMVMIYGKMQYRFIMNTVI